MNDTVQSEIKTIVDSNDVVLFMKGTKAEPQCGFSGRVAAILQHLDINFQDVNVLDNEDIRQGVKDYANWPTVPQLYVKGEFVGGCDIVTEMTLSGELDKVFDGKGVAFNHDAANAIRESNELK